jgi:outer membrane protein
VLKNKQFVCFALVLAAAIEVRAQTAPPAKIGIIHVQAAILSTKEGKRAGDELNGKFGQRKTELEKRQAGIDQLKEQLQKGSATLSEDAKNRLMRQIDSETTSLKRATEDAQADMEQEEGKIINGLGAKLYAIVEKYARDNGFSIIIDVSGQNQPVWWASESINITNEVIALYDKANPGGAASAPASKPKTTSAPAPATSNPAPPAAAQPASTGGSSAPTAAPKKQ